MHTQRFLPTAVLAIVIGLAAADTDAGERVYKWVDADGVVHFGQQPPTAVKAEAITVQKGYSAPAPEASAEPTDEEKKRAADAETCRVATENFSKLSSTAEVQRVDEYGETHAMTQEEKDTEKERAKSAMDRYCKPAEGAADQQGAPPAR